MRGIRHGPMPYRRRAILALCLAWAAWRSPAAAAGADQAGPPWPPVEPGRALHFPRDFGAHPAYRIEWWYLTGWLEPATGDQASPRGFQLTFFRLRPRVQEALPSAFAARQLLFAHAALADPARGRLRQAEKSARAGFGLAFVDESDTAMAIDDWQLRREGGSYQATVQAADFSFTLQASTPQPPLLHGEAGFSRKAPDPGSASYYYSRPQLSVSGTLEVAGRRQEVRGRAWLDHEWASSLLPPAAVGWDWLGLNLADGGALMAFRLRDQGGGSLWAAATRWYPGGRIERPPAAAITFQSRRQWRSPRSGASYPVALELQVGEERYTLEPLLDDQEVDARHSVGALYWEGAVQALRDGQPAGRGYLELTGYGKRLRY